jgi:8-oxo-dGTP pyrophosphatase MutT (NUDIX family)
METPLPDRLERRLKEPLPGREAQEACAVEMSFGRHFGPERHDARQAAVIALLYRRGTEWRLPLIVRPPQLLHHAGQVSLPGGLIEPGEDERHAALRELHEELGIVPDSVRLLGELSPLYVFSSNHRVAPVVGYLAVEPRFQVNALEVARLLEAPIDFLMQRDNLTVMERPEAGSRAKALAYFWDGEAIWGATCMILTELMAVLRDALPAGVS